jgi:alpha-D-ribose 1-methylphosphonate 5-triphosphate synthase subunit PhnH
MSIAATARPYDPVFDGQRHYRAVLNCTARPGSIGFLDGVQLETPEGLNLATTLIALMLFSGDVSFYLRPEARAAISFLRQQAQAVEAPAAQADFLLLNAKDADSAVSAMKSAKTGSLVFPETGATVLLEVEGISPVAFSDCLRLTLSGPGIETESIVFVAGMSPDFLDVLRNRNCEFPTGIDLLLTCDSLSAGPCVLSIPRTTNVRWEPVKLAEKEGGSWDM